MLSLDVQAKIVQFSKDGEQIEGFEIVASKKVIRFYSDTEAADSHSNIEWVQKINSIVSSFTIGKSKKVETRHSSFIVNPAISPHNGQSITGLLPLKR